MTVCCWQARDDGSVYVLVHLAKDGKNGELSSAVLVQGEGDFKDSRSAISVSRSFTFCFFVHRDWGPVSTVSYRSCEQQCARLVC